MIKTSLKIYIYSILAAILIGTSACSEDPPPDCQALNPDVHVQVTNNYPGTINFYYRIVNIYGVETSSASPLGFLGINSNEYECMERELDRTAFQIAEGFQGEKTIKNAKEIVALLEVRDVATQRLLPINISARIATSLVITEEGEVMGVDYSIN